MSTTHQKSPIDLFLIGGRGGPDAFALGDVQVPLVVAFHDEVTARGGAVGSRVTVVEANNYGGNSE